MKNKIAFLLLSISLAANAYKEDTHVMLSNYAAIKSNIVADSSLFSSLGLENYYTQTFHDPDQPNDTNAKLKVIALIMQGANFEDRFPRSLAHFYDPINNSGLGTSNASPDWALEDIGDVNSGIDGPQEYSYKDAKQYFYMALTSQTEDERSLNWGKTFQTLGQVIHHVEDMSQPEHVRNDDHCDNPLCIAIARYDPSWYEKYTDDNKTGSHISGLMSGGSYPIPTFLTARDFWTTRATDAADVQRRGVADFTNLNFVSNNTNFDYDADGLLLATDYHYPQPVQLVSRNIADADVLGTAGQDLCTKLKSSASNVAPGNCYIDFVSTNVIGAVAGENPVNERASSYSVFNKYLEAYQLTVGIPGEDGTETARGFFTLNSLNYDAAHNYLIPRAVAYSAGLINHFFRGRMQISLPDAGVYGLVDKSTLPSINLETGFAGFSTIKFKLANTSAPLPNQTTAEAMNNGTLEAVIKFHRNTCTEADLSGEPPNKTIAVTTDGSQCRSAQEEIVIATAQTISVANALTSTPREFTFTFPTNQELPLNAIDVYLQAVYKGQLGDETQAVVVATQDISEPSFVTILNSSDYLATVLQVQNYKAYVINDLNHQQLTEILSDLGIADTEKNIYCLGGPIDNMVWTGGAVSASGYRVACIPSVDPHIKIFDKYTLNRNAAAPIKITLDGLPQQRHATLAFLTDKDGVVTLENTGVIDWVSGLTAFDAATSPHVYCGYQYPGLASGLACQLKVNQTQFGPTNTLPPTAVGKARSTYATGPVLNVFYTDQIAGSNTSSGGSQAVYLTVNPNNQLFGAYKVINDMMSPVPASSPFPVTIEGWQ